MNHYEQIVCGEMTLDLQVVPLPEECFDEIVSP